MNLIELDAASPAPPGLGEFESSFSYPLGSGLRFRISHAPDYGRFYESMGESRRFIAADRGRVVGALSAAIRRLQTPQGAEQPAAYLGDLKVIPEARGGRALLLLVRAALAWAVPRAAVGLSIVMEGTEATPADYTNRLGVPAFREVGRLSLFRIAGDPREPEDDERDGPEIFEVLSRGRTVVRSGDPAIRSLIPPRWRVDRERTACGRLEDTMKAKRLYLVEGDELRSGHLSCFAYRTPEAGARLALRAAGTAARADLPALWVPVPAEDAPEFRNFLNAKVASESRAVVYGTGSPSPSWCVQSSEI